MFVFSKLRLYCVYYTYFREYLSVFLSLFLRLAFSVLPFSLKLRCLSFLCISVICIYAFHSIEIQQINIKLTCYSLLSLLRRVAPIAKYSDQFMISSSQENYPLYFHVHCLSYAISSCFFCDHSNSLLFPLFSRPSSLICNVYMTVTIG